MTAHAILFDMDGLLLDTEKVCLDSFVETRRLFSLSDSPDVFLRCVGVRRPECDQIIRESLFDQVEFQAFNEAWREEISATLRRDVPLKAGALQLVQILASKGYLMGVATSTQTEVARSHLEKTGLLPYFGGVIGGDLVQEGKPNPEVYHKIAQHLGVSAADCIAFEDSETGTRAAVASGARTIQIPDLIPPSADMLELGHVIASSLLEGALKVELIKTSDF
ncbi:HAD family phosphatase [Labrenzia sp. DG1229]|uniref:HAD family hydrolase n=1 Tax=Labrenzia sp. DG1229 TaxID=681847 RepID=UPI00068D5781|nr:HAD family phosphatase [Labrenzia sp. DG1229]